ncbi:MAG: hypothetical protein KJ970_02300 [Candidatus Eisenbacteria bacterium]|uniref:Uncharacterized protein n=1 Tax=Eiseniibacteriota bacterium TaxID=2212470 RepID=A0A948RU33_UNCEI|nr:hypothetical protein [Candidatus Eisenbacteria bacterium]MBU1949499.1 hypothetical protein [Candidatus Eisenbacteria bacterium]MBU2689729.1 hypothetical protein [Candidatus Eisenbacteria bacterium]
MRRILLVSFVAVLLTLPSLILAGPNEGVYLAVHGNVDGIETNGDIFGSITIPANAADFSPTATPDAGGVEWFQLIVVSPPENTPNFNTIVFGIPTAYQNITSIDFWGPIAPGGAAIPLPIYTSGWPNGPGTRGAAVSWAPGCFYEHLQPVFYFGCYSYNAGYVALGAHPVQGGVVVDCGSNPQTDTFTSYPVFSVGGTAYGPCCVPVMEEGDPNCLILTMEDCTLADGSFLNGQWVTCKNPDPCYVPVQQTTWGSIKRTYQ